MKKVFLMLALSFLSAGAQANGIDDILDLINPGPGNYEPGRPGRPDRPNRPNRPGRPDYGYPGGGNYSCHAVDDGYEEHRGGHANCQECLGIGHGNCIETCSNLSFVCTAEGTDYYGNRYTVQGIGDSRYRAEDDAIYRCRGQLNNCYVTDCQVQEQQVSRRYCR